MGEYMNTATWSHYTWQRGMTVPTNHAVTIIGWDDDYPADNFLEEHRPPQDGAWLVKNSWGSGENEFPNRATGLWGLPIDPDDPAKGVPDISGCPTMTSRFPCLWFISSIIPCSAQPRNPVWIRRPW